MKPKVSIIIPCYNVKKELFKNCICSVLKQTFKNFELFIINDGSKKSFFWWINWCKVFSERIKEINKENGGVSTAKNRELEEARGD